MTRALRALVLVCSIWLGLPEARSAAAASREPAAGAQGGDLSRIERALAAREYEASETEGVLQAPNRAHGLRTYFEPRGIRVHGRTAPDGPELLGSDAIGCRPQRRAFARPAGRGHQPERARRDPQARARRVVRELAGRARAGLHARRAPGGRRPARARARSAGSPALRRPRDPRDGAANRLAYAGLVARDARGAAVLARFELPSTQRLRLVIDDAGAVYPLPRLESGRAAHGGPLRP